MVKTWMEVSASDVHTVGYGTGSPPQGHHGPHLQIKLRSQALFPTTVAGNRPSGIDGSGRLTHHRRQLVSAGQISHRCSTLELLAQLLAERAQEI